MPTAALPGPSGEQPFESESAFRLLFEHHPVPMWVFDVETLAFLEVNAAAVLKYGWSRDEFLAMTLRDIRPPEDLARLDHAVRDPHGPLYFAGQWRHRVRDGHLIDVAITSHTLTFRGRTARLVSIIDVTEQQEAVHRIGRLHRVLGVISDTNQAIVRERDIAKLFERVCRIAVTRGRFLMAWVGVPTADGRAFDVLAGEVADDAPAELIVGPIGAETPLTMPAIVRLRAGERLIANDLASMAGTSHRIDEIIACGCRSAASWPLQVDGETRAVLALYAREEHFFDADELTLLDEVSMDIAFAIEVEEKERHRTEAQRLLRESEERIRLSADAVGMGVWDQDLVNGDLRWSPTIYRQLGFDPSKPPPSIETWRTHVHPEDREALLERVSASASTGEAVRAEFRFFRADDGALRWLSMAARHDYDAEGTPVRLRGVSFDVTDAKVAEAVARTTAERLRLTIDVTGIGPWALDLVRGEIYFSPEWKRQLGYEDHEIANDLMEKESRVHPDDLSYVRESMAAYLLDPSGDYQLDFRMRHKDGSYRWILSRASLLRDDMGRPNRVLGFHIDVTDRHVVEEELRRLNAELELRVAERTAELTERNRELETFTYTVSHDLKAPLRGLDGYSRLLLEDHAASLNDEGKTFLRTIRGAASQMGQLIDDLLTYSRVERRAWHPAVFPLRRLVDGELAQRGRDVETLGVTVAVAIPDDLTVTIDPEGFSMALRNLIDNAIKFSSRAASPRVELEAERRGDRVALHVRDNGVGFDMKFRERIFEIFQRLHRAEDYPGTGVGLAIVRKAMQRMGGGVTAESVPGEGATFTLEIPA